jgi:sugar/nucleoside kinase (ribokinase family)
VAVVTCGARGAIAIDAGTSEAVTCPGVPVRAVDTTAAGDIFGGALVYAYLQPGWTLAQRVGFGALCAALAVGRPGGSVSAPRPADLRAWLACAPVELRAIYGFLADHLAQGR